jgi:hypothetical protein
MLSYRVILDMPAELSPYRYLNEAVEVLTARAPSLRQALEKSRELGLPYLILDGKIVASDRCTEKTVSRKGREIDRWYSGKTRAHGGSIQALSTPRDVPLWSLVRYPAAPMALPLPVSTC